MGWYGLAVRLLLGVWRRRGCEAYVIPLRATHVGDRSDAGDVGIAFRLFWRRTGDAFASRRRDERLVGSGRGCVVKGADLLRNGHCRVVEVMQEAMQEAKMVPSYQRLPRPRRGVVSLDLICKCEWNLYVSARNLWTTDGRDDKEVT